jgi:hypothetical protein
VQLTWLENYEKASAVAGVDLVQFPDKMLDAEISARVLWKGLLGGWWGPKGLRFYLDKGDAISARHTVNGTDKAALIAGYYDKFLGALNGAKQAAPAPSKPIAAPTPAPKPQGGLAGRILGLFGKGKA